MLFLRMLQVFFSSASAILVVVGLQLKPNSITLSWSQTGPRLVADLQRAGTWPITGSEGREGTSDPACQTASLTRDTCMTVDWAVQAYMCSIRAMKI